MRPDLPDLLIKHVVVLMLENRGFDHVMGWLYKQEPGEAPDYRLISHNGDPRPFMGLSTLTPQQLDALANPMPDPPGPLAEVRAPIKVTINKGARFPKTPSYNTGEDFQHIMNQMWGLGEPKETWLNRDTRIAKLDELARQGIVVPPMTGYVRDYAIDVADKAKVTLGERELSEVLDTYVPEQLPVLSGLARSFAVSDEWFCSVPSQTNTNRAFSVAGTSRGLVNNSFYDPPTWNPGVAGFKSKAEGKSHADALPVSTRSLFEVLQEGGVSWKIYWQSKWPPDPVVLGADWRYTRTMLPFLRDEQFEPNFVEFDASDPQNPFFKAASEGELPAVSWIEPKWGGGAKWDLATRLVGNDYHPVSDTTVGEDFVANVYRALSRSDKWKNTLLVITFDENGGTYDHVPPPDAPPPGNESCPLPHPQIFRNDLELTPDGTARTQFGFDFAQYGVRVPTLLISPQIPPKTLFRSPDPNKVFDHTSIIATILKLANIDPSRWLLGQRVQNAPTFEQVTRLLPPPAQPGGVEHLNRPRKPLSVSDGRRDEAELSTNQTYILEYLGDPWVERPPLRYLAAKTDSSLPGYRYPTLSRTLADAVQIKLQTVDGGANPEPIGNMSKLRIISTEAETTFASGNMIAYSNAHSCAFYSSQTGSHSEWEIRLLGSRERDDRVRLGDRVYFVSQLPSVFYRRVMEQTLTDPLQRLIAHPTVDKMLGIAAGEWALWRILPVPAPPPVEPGLGGI